MLNAQKSLCRQVHAVAVCLALCLPLMAAGGDAVLATVLERYRSTLLEGAAPEAETIREYQTALRADGRWPDVDYKDKSRGYWRTTVHLGRINEMALAYAWKDHPLQGDKSLLRSMDLALDHWLAQRYRNPNWWHNVIGVPRAVGDIAVLLGDDLSPERRKGILELMSGCPISRTGANLMDQAEIVMVRACLSDDAALLRKASDAVAKEVVTGRKEGIQDDGSYYQHGARSQPLSYGKVYLNALARVAWMLRGTPYELPKEKRAIASAFLLNGIQWMVRGTYTAPSTIDRQVSRKDALAGSGNFRSVLKRWIQVDPANAQPLQEFLARQSGEGEPLVGFRHFRRSDLTTYHRSGFAFFLRTRSTRVMGTERGNGENLKGKPFLHTGDHYLVMDGSEYTTMPPVWDWTRLPGLTMYEGIGEIQPQTFVGGLGDGTSGLAAMDYRRSLGVRKLWACHGDLVVCLLGGWLDATGKKDLRTTLDQCAQQGPVEVSADGRRTSLDGGTHQLRNVDWVLHNGVGYVPLAPSAMSMKLGEIEGSWHDICLGHSDSKVLRKVFLCELVHGDTPPASGFALVPGATAETLDRLVKRPPYSVIRNDRDAQCIRFADGTLMAALYSPGKVEADGNVLLSVDRPCLALGSTKGLWLCDPTNSSQGTAVRISWQGTERSVTLPPSGRAVCVQGAVAE